MVSAECGQPEIAGGCGQNSRLALQEWLTKVKFRVLKCFFFFPKRWISLRTTVVPRNRKVTGSVVTSRAACSVSGGVLSGFPGFPATVHRHVLYTGLTGTLLG